MLRRHHVLAHGGALERTEVFGRGGATVGGDPDSAYTSAGLPPPPKDSTGNDRSDKFRSQVYAGALVLAKADPELAPFLAVGLVVFEGWIRFGAFLSGESKDDEKYQYDAQVAINDFLIHGFIPRKWVSDVEFAADYAHFLGKQLNALTYYAVGSSTFVAELCTDLGLTMIELATLPIMKDRLAKGNASPFSGAVPDTGWRYGIYDSYPDAWLLGTVAAARWGGDAGAAQVHISSLLQMLRSKGVTMPTTWPTDPSDQAYASAAGTATVWYLLGGRSRGYFLSASGALVDPATRGVYKGPLNVPFEVMKKAPSIARPINVFAQNPPVFFSSTASKVALGAGALGSGLFLAVKHVPVVAKLFRSFFP